MVLSPLEAYTVVHVILIWSLKLGTLTKYVVSLRTILDQAPFIRQLLAPVY